MTPVAPATGSHRRPYDATRRVGARRLLALLALAAWAALGTVAAESGSDDPLARSPAELVSARPIGAPCGDDGAVVELLGVGRAVYDRIDIDGGTGSGRLWGGVCIEVPDADAVLRAQEVRLSGVDVDGAGGPPPELVVFDAELDLNGWRLAIGTLEGPVDALSVRDVHLIGPELIGVADQGDLTLAGGTLRGVSLATDAWRFDAARLEVSSERAILTDLIATPCLCDAPRYRLAGRTATLALDGGSAELTAPSLLLGGTRVPLGDRLTLDPDDPGLGLPLRIETRSGLGTVIALADTASDGSRFEVGTASEPTRGPLAGLTVRQGGTRVDLAADPRGLQARFRRETDLGSGVAATGFADADLRGTRGLLRSGAQVAWASPTWRTSLADGGPELATTVEARLGAELAAEPRLDRSPVGPSGLRLPAWVEARLRLPVDRVGAFELRATAEGAAYPLTIGTVRSGADPTAARAAVTLAPSWTTTGGGARLRLAAERRWTAGERPYAFDAAADRFRLAGEASWRGGPDALEVDASARVVWRLAPETPGAETLTARLAMDLALAPGVTATPSLRTELAGLAGGSANRDWWEAALRLRTPGELEADLQARFGVRDGTLRSATASARVPFEVPFDRPDPSGLQGLRVAPYLKLDATGPLRGDGPLVVSEHGVRLHLRDCCGTFTVGYLASEDGVGVELGFALPDLWRDPAGPPELPTDWPDPFGAGAPVPDVR